MRKRPIVVLLLLTAASWQACTTTKTVASAASKNPLLQFAEDSLLSQPGLRSAQVGISLYDPATSARIFDYQGDKYFMPASNTKLFSLYAGLKYLGDSLVGIRYRLTDTAMFIIPTGDPTLLHPAYADQPVIRFLQKAGRNIYISDNNWKDRPLGRGWAWDDYNDDYMPERSPLPVYGNYIRWKFDSVSASFYSIPDIDWPVRFSPDSSRRGFLVQRDFHDNAFNIDEGTGGAKEQDVPFITDGNASAALLLKDTIGRPVNLQRLRDHWISFPGTTNPRDMNFYGDQLIHSRPVDSLFVPMMHNSDNFFAEQTLLMVSNEFLGQMNDARIIDTLLKTDLKGLPQRPIWVDGSGLSRDDNFTPQDFIWLLDTMRKQYGLERMERILPTGGKGTLASYYRQDAGYIFAKTGSLSGVVALSGYLITKKNHLLLFSILINNYTGSGVTVRRRMEKLIHYIRDKY
jgi:D-alanyl-D-alanine carboxypeptidase/D-alanyl-D-alanine-endopeptidase (penicillin-binding protein 4)